MEVINNQTGFDPDHVIQMENAANMLMSPNVSHDSRQAAEKFFLNIRNEKISPEYCRLIIEATSNEFVIFEMVQLMVMNLFKQWSILEPPIFRQCFEYLLENAVHKFRTSKLIRGEMLRACAKLLKRSIFDGKACDADTLDQTVHFLLTNENPEFQTIACEFIEAIASEFATSWRASNLCISFDFHLRARRSFENGGLQRLFEKCIRTCSELFFTANLSLPYYMSICENFLRVADLVLSWNFEIHRFPVRITFANEGAPAAALRPPESWKAIFQSDEFLRLFFELHKRVRHSETLCTHSMNCLIQLSSLMGPVLTDNESFVSQKLSTSNSSNFVNAHDRYVSNFIAGFVDLFESGPLEGEISGFCMIIHKLLTYHRILSFPRAEMSFIKFVTIIIRCAEYLTPIAVRKALVEDDCVFIESLQNIYDGWWVILRNNDIIRNASRLPVNFEDSTLAIISAFTRTVLSEPYGCRVKVPIQECNEEIDDDREIFEKLLNDIGRFSAFYCAQMLPHMFTVLFDKIKQFLSFMETGVNDEALNTWREDMHWTLLLTGFMLTSSDDDGSSHLQNDLLDHFEHLSYDTVVDIDSSVPYIKTCIDSPNTITNPARVDPLIKVIGAVLAWCSIEHKLLMDRGAEAVSPELVRSSLWCAGRLICALGFHVLNPEDSERLATIIRNVLQTIVDFALQKSFGVLNNLSGERKLCVDAVEVFVDLVRASCNESAKSPFLFLYISTIQIERLPARHSFLKVLVQIGAIVDDENIKKTLYEMVLQPLRERFMLLSKEQASLETDLVDLMDCFGGVAEAAYNYNTRFLFEYLSPILTCSVGLLLSHKESQLITNAVLNLFNNVTRRMGVYNDDRNNMIFLYETLLELVRVYRDGQFTRYKLIDVDVEEKASDLIILLDILANVLSRDVLSIIPSSSSEATEFIKSGSRVALIALEMLLPIMEDDLLKLPLLCRKFYRFILYFTEMTPQSLENLSETLFVSIIECLRHGLKSDFGQEISLISAEIISEVASYFARHTPKNETAIAHFSVLLKPTFELCLNCSWQVDLQSASATALFSLICCNQVAFEEYVKQLLSRNENLPYQTALQLAFQALLPTNLELRLGRREKRDFRDRLEQFLNQSQELVIYMSKLTIMYRNEWINSDFLGGSVFLTVNFYNGIRLMSERNFEYKFFLLIIKLTFRCASDILKRETRRSELSVEEIGKIFLRFFDSTSVKASISAGHM
ncbi:Exportin-4 [Dirofilaria immitis]